MMAWLFPEYRVLWNGTQHVTYKNMLRVRRLQYTKKKNHWEVLFFKKVSWTEVFSFSIFPI